MYRMRRGNDDTRKVKSPKRARRVASLGGPLALALLVGFVVSCEEAGPKPTDLVTVDSVLAELGGNLMSRMERGQRWRMIASVGVGLPPREFTGDDLPEPGSRGAGLVQVYCIQCHWLPTPTMHSPDEWDIILPRMYLRAQQLENRLGGPLTTGMVGEIVMSGFQSTAVPSEADADTLAAYMRRYGLQTVDPEELSAGPGRELFIERCSTCHETPAPSAHTVTGWERLVKEMQEYTQLMQLDPLTDREVDQITAYLRERATR